MHLSITPSWASCTTQYCQVLSHTHASVLSATIYIQNFQHKRKTVSEGKTEVYHGLRSDYLVIVCDKAINCIVKLIDAEIDIELQCNQRWGHQMYQREEGGRL